mgnify:CR=1 FL=1
MLDESMRGSSMSHISYEVDRGDHVSVQLVTYTCHEGHKTTLPFAADAEEIPTTWECNCGQIASLPDVEIPEPAPVRTRRSHYEIVRERRSEDELAQMFVMKLHQLHDYDSLRSA